MVCLFLFFLFHQLPAQMQPAWQESEYLNLFNLASYSKLSESTPVDLNHLYLHTYKTALSNLIFETPKEEKVTQQLEMAINQIKTSSLPGFLKKYYLADLLILSANIELKQGNELKFLWIINDAYRITKDLVAENPEFIPGIKIYGVLKIVIGAVPDQYQWIFNLLGYEGDTEEGLKLLKELNESDLPVRYESLLLTAIIKNYLKSDVDISSLELLEKEIKNNELLTLLNLTAALAYIKQHNSDKAHDHLMKIKHIESPYISYLTAEIFLYRGDYSKAITYYLRFINNTSGGNLIKDAYTKIYLGHYILGNTLEAKKYYKIALNAGNLNTEADKNAQHILNDPTPAHPIIFKLRYYTDGGFYKKGLMLLDSAKELNYTKEDEIELQYRKARLFHLNNNQKKAIPLYKKTLKESEGRYFAPNSALQLGYIYSEKGHYDLAKLYFERVLKFKNYLYESSIKSKARHGLKNLKQ